MIGQNIKNIKNLDLKKVNNNKKNNSQILNKSKIDSIKILCIGDIVLDRYVYGSVHRESPEAPIPILSYERDNFQLGGAGNVARNISCFGSKCALLSIIGYDDASLKINELVLKEKNIRPKLIKIKNFKTPVKTRYIKNSQHLLRVDDEQVNFKLEKKSIIKIKNLVLKNINNCDLVILSDYDKGILNKTLIKYIIKIAKEKKKLIIADPKKIDFASYKGIDILTPNLKEITDSTKQKLNSEKKLVNYARNIIKKYNIKEILVTRSSKGMILIGSNYINKIAANAKVVKDVTGAGDTVISIIGLMKAIGMSTSDSSTLANSAAGIIVGKLGTASLSYYELVKKNDYKKLLHKYRT